jgi:hypothetical protein
MDEVTRGRLLLGTGGLALLQVLHSLDVFRYSDDVTLSGLFLKPDAVVGIGSCLIAFVLLNRGSTAARLWSIGAAAVVTLGFIQHHLLPTYSGAANPYWTFDEGFRGDFIRWFTVLAIVAAGVWTAWTAWQAKDVATVEA